MPKYYEIKAAADGKAELFMFGDIGDSSYDEVNLKKFTDDIKAAGDVAEIDLYIQSLGGSVFAGVAIQNTLKNHPAKITGHIQGVAASMATVVLMGCDHVVMPSNALFMIHQPWTYAAGNAADLRKTADLLDKTSEASIVSAYSQKTGLPDDKIKELMDAETWMTAQEAHDLGFVDEISEEIDMAACVRGLDLSGYRNAPKALFTHKSETTDDTNEENAMPQEQKATAQASAQSDNPINNQVDVDAIAAKARDEALKIEAKRREDVAAVFAMFPGQHADLQAQCLMDGSVTKAKAQELLLAKLGSQSEPLGHDVRVTMDHRAKVMDGFTNALMARGGLISSKGQERNEFRGYGLTEMARMCLENRGVSTRNMDRLEMVGAAFTHSSGDFPNLLQNVMFKSMLKGWEEAPETFQTWTNKGILTDFKPASRVGLNSVPNLDEIPAGAEYKYGTVGDRGETIQLATYGKLISMNRQTIINDDLQAFTRIPMMMGRAALRTIGNLVYAVLTSNPTMADGVALFHASHNNLGTTGALATGTIDELRALMAKQTDGNAHALGITPGYLIVPEALRGAAMVVMESETEIAANQNNSRKPNSVRNIASVISDARLDANSTTQYYLVANPAMFDTIEVAYLDGVETPFLEQQQGWNIDGTSFKVRIDAGVKALDHRTLARNAGA